MDIFLLVDTGITDDTLAVAKGAVGERLLVLPCPEGATNSAAARAAGLAFAEEAIPLAS